MSLCPLRCLWTAPGAHSEWSLSHPFPFTLLIEEALLAISRGSLTKQEVGNGMEEVCREIVFHFKMSAVEEERYIRAHRTFLGSLLWISCKSICWLLKGTKKKGCNLYWPSREGARYFLLKCWWRMEFSFISEGHLEHFIYARAVFIVFVFL